MDNYSFIKRFQEIKISKICEEKGINLGNLLSGSTSDENYSRVKNELIRQLLMLLIEDKKEDLLLIGFYNELLEKQEKEIKALKEMI